MVDQVEAVAAKTVPHANIHEAKIAVMEAVEYIQKTGTMTGTARYKYVSVDEVIARLRPAMIRHGIHFTPIGMEVISNEPYETSGGKTMNHVIIGVQYRLTHTSGTFDEGHAVGEGSDTGDKACNKAMTAAKKYALLQSFCLETGEEDPDHDPSDDQTRKPNGSAKPAANGSGKKSDPCALAREEYKAKIPAMTGKTLLAALSRFDESPEVAAEKFGKDEVDYLRAATVTQLYKSLDISIGGIPTLPEVEKWKKSFEEHSAKYLTGMQVDTLLARLEKRRIDVQEDLETAQRRTR